MIEEYLMGFSEAIFGNFVWVAFMNWKYENYNIDKKKIACRTIIAAGAAYVWLALNMPNSFNLFLAGLAAPEIVEGVLDRAMNKPKEKIINKMDE